MPVHARPAPSTIRRAAATIADIDEKHASVARMLEAIADGRLHVHSAVHIHPDDILGNAAVRRLAGRHLGDRRNIERATLIRWRKGIGVPEPFPAPFKRINGDELWDRRVVVAWLEANRPIT